MVLGIQHQGGGFTGAPRGSSMIHAGDVLIVYGQAKDVVALDKGWSAESSER